MALPDTVSPPRRTTGMDLCVMVRASPDWGLLTQEQFEAQAREFCRQVNRPVEQTVETARLWDRTFRTSFCETRQQMKAVAQQFLGRMQAREIFYGPPPDIQPGTLYLVTDDDDWCCPELAAALADVPPEGYDGVTWGSVVFGPLHRLSDEPILDQPNAFKLRPLGSVCYSNNYALTSEYFQRPNASWSKVFSHGHASEEFRNLRVYRIERYLGIKNTNPASTVFLENGLRRDFSAARLRQLLDQYNTRLDAAIPQLDAQLDWAKPSIITVRNFFRELADTAR